MKRIIYDFDYKNKIIYCLVKKQKRAFYLSNRLFKLFGPHFKKGVLIDFEIGKRRIINGIPSETIKHFNQIVSLNPHRVVYDLEVLRNDMYNVLSENEYYLFTDFEMSMPGYSSKDKFTPEIIQAGLILAKKFEQPLMKYQFYVHTHNQTPLSKRTLKFLNINNEEYLQNAKPFTYLSSLIGEVIDQYNPKIIIWGKNDQMVLLNSLNRYDSNLYLSPYDFIDLLQLHKNYYNLDNDIGLFKAYSQYYNKTPNQTHDAYEDALVTKYVFEGFLNEIKKHNK